MSWWDVQTLNLSPTRNLVAQPCGVRDVRNRPNADIRGIASARCRPSARPNLFASCFNRRLSGSTLTAEAPGQGLCFANLEIPDGIIGAGWLPVPNPGPDRTPVLGRHNYTPIRNAVRKRPLIEHGRRAGLTPRSESTLMDHSAKPAIPGLFTESKPSTPSSGAPRAPDARPRRRQAGSAPQSAHPPCLSRSSRTAAPPRPAFLRVSRNNRTGSAG